MSVWFPWQSPLLPSFRTLRALYKNKIIALSPFNQYRIVHWIQQSPSTDQDDWLRRICKGDMKQLILLGRVIQKHSKGVMISSDYVDGRPIAQKLFENALKSGDLDAEFVYAKGLYDGLSIRCLILKRKEFGIGSTGSNAWIATVGISS